MGHLFNIGTNFGVKKIESCYSPPLFSIVFVMVFNYLFFIKKKHKNGLI